jgi:hypothetical protein
LSFLVKSLSVAVVWIVLCGSAPDRFVYEPKRMNVTKELRTGEADLRRTVGLMRMASGTVPGSDANEAITGDD